MIEYIVNSLAWSVLGFMAGVFAGGIYRDVRETREAVVSDDHAEPAGSHRENGHPYSRWFGVLLVIVALFMVIQTTYFVRQQREVAECQAEVNNTFARVVTRRAQFANEDRRALDDTIRAILTQDNSEQALQDYLRTVERNDRRRAQHPLPELPETQCK